MNAASMIKIVTKILSDKTVEFKWLIRGKISRARVEYGDGATEDLTLPNNTEHPTLYCEHAYKPGRYKVMFVIFDSANQVIDRHVLAFGS